MKTKTKIGVVSMVSLNLSSMVVGNAIAAISQSFKSVPISTIQLLSTLPGLGTLLMTIVAGQCAMHVSKKKLALLGVALITIGGMLPLVVNQSIIALLVCSIVLGGGIGFVTTINPMLVSEYFEGEERSNVLGLGTGVTSLGGMLLMALGGYLGGKNWHNLYWVFALGIVVFLIILFTLPNDQPISTQNGPKEKTNTWKIIKSLSAWVIVVYVAIFALVIGYNAYMSNLSIIIAQKHIGGTALTGLVNAVGTIGGIAAGFGFKYIRKFTKPNTLAFGFGCTFVALVVTYFADNFVLFAIGGLLAAVGMVCVMASCPFLLSMIAKPEHIPVVMSIYAFINGLAGAIEPKIISMLGIAAGGPTLYFSAIIVAVVGVALLVMRFGKKAENGELIPQ